jgi:hypothetical protein
VTDLETAIWATLKRGAPSRGLEPQCPMQYGLAAAGKDADADVAAGR